MECQFVIKDQVQSDNDEPHYEYSDNVQTNQDFGFIDYEDDLMGNVYSPQQPGLLKKTSNMAQLDLNNDEYDLDFQPQPPQDFKRKNKYQYTHLIKKKIRLDQHDEQNNSTTVSHDTSIEIINEPIKNIDDALFHQEGDLEKLIHDIHLESKSASTIPRQFIIPTVEEVQKHLKSLEMRFKPCSKQEEFLRSYVNEEDVKKLKIGLDSEMLNDAETNKFEEWVDRLCNSTNHQLLKELSRRQKVTYYLQKKHNRTYEKKVHYHVRQKVAEERLRVKGRFVTWNQALSMLDYKTDNKNPWNYDDYFRIKSMLNEKFGACKSSRLI